MNIEQVVQLVFYLILCVFTKKKYGAVQSCCLDKCSKSGGLCFPSPPARANLATAGRKIEEKWLLDTQLIIEDKIYESVFLLYRSSYLYLKLLAVADGLQRC